MRERLEPLLPLALGEGDVEPDAGEDDAEGVGDGEGVALGAGEGEGEGEGAERGAGVGAGAGAGAGSPNPGGRIDSGEFCAITGMDTANAATPAEAIAKVLIEYRISSSTLGR